MRILLIAPLLAALALPVEARGAEWAEAGPVASVETCPLGGGRFRFATTRYYMTYGERPDGKPFGSWTFPLALPECPENGLIVYRHFERGELRRLERLVASPAYRALRKKGTPHYRAYWLLMAMKESPNLSVWNLIKATWEAEANPRLRKAYLAELAETVAGVPDLDHIDWVVLEARSINALRELGRFDEALARLEKFPVASLNIPVPASNGRNATRIIDARSSRVWYTWFGVLKTVIERRDSSIEPLDLLPRSVALGRCLERVDRLDEAGRAFCAREAAGIETLRTARRKLDEEAPVALDLVPARGR
jgi:hypothetical protein